MPDGWHRLHRMQELGRGLSGPDSETDAGAADKIRGESAARLGYSGGWLGASAESGVQYDGRSAGSNEDVARLRNAEQRARSAVEALMTEEAKTAVEEQSHLAAASVAAPVTSGVKK